MAVDKAVRPREGENPRPVEADTALPGEKIARQGAPEVAEALMRAFSQPVEGSTALEQSNDRAWAALRRTRSLVRGDLVVE